MQSKREREALKAAWHATPEVVGLADAIRRHAQREGLAWDAAGLTGALQAAIAWQAQHGPLPVSGIVCE